jgi:competence protein ComEC
MVSIISALLIGNLAVWSATFAHDETGRLRVYFFDVGQGDSILIDSPTHGRVLIDGGPDRKVLSELGKVLPFGDKRIDVVMATHPDADHITGLVEVLGRYDVGVIIESGAVSDNSRDEALAKAAEARGVERVIARRAMNLSLGGGARLLLLFPNRDVSEWGTNDASIVSLLEYGDTEVLFMGDSPKKTEYLLMQLNGRAIDADILHVGHHGSDTSTSLLFADTVSPEYAVISAGRDNRYGHPHPNVVETLAKTGTEILATYDAGTIVFETDGENIILK